MDPMGYESLRISPEDFSVPGVSGNLKGSSLTKSGKNCRNLQPQSLTARPSKMMVGRLLTFLLGFRSILQGLLLLNFQGSMDTEKKKVPFFLLKVGRVFTFRCFQQSTNPFLGCYHVD